MYTINATIRIKAHRDASIQKTQQLTPKYIRIKVSGNNTQSKRTTTATTKGCL